MKRELILYLAIVGGLFVLSWNAAHSIPHYSSEDYEDYYDYEDHGSPEYFEDAWDRVLHTKDDIVTLFKRFPTDLF